MRGIANEANYCGDPYRDGALRAETRTLAVIGTGLTAADTIVMAATLNPKITIHAISRHGLFPAIQGGGNFAATELDILSVLEDAPALGAADPGSVQSLAREVERRGGDWRDTITLGR